MKIFKFGGSVIKDSISLTSAIKIVSKEVNQQDPTSISNLYYIKQKNAKYAQNITLEKSSSEKRNKQNHLIIVISALGKTTSLLEKIYNLNCQNINYLDLLNEFYSFHKDCLKELNLETSINGFITDTGFIHNHEKQAFETLEVTEGLYEKCLKILDTSFEEIKIILNKNKGINNLSVYDKIISFGEYLSSKFFYYYLLQFGINSKWIDITNFIKTDNSFGNANIDYKVTEQNLLNSLSWKNGIIVTQGFLGSTTDNKITTLGKEGSDYSASVLASLLNASLIILWKDVDGIMNADPKILSNAIKLEEVSYKEMAEISYYGAKVIHPKTIQSLYEKNIPLYIKSFAKPDNKGTKIHLDALAINLPIYILKKNQCLITLYLKNYTFIDQAKINYILNFLNSYNLNINIIEQSALSLSICIDENNLCLSKLIVSLKDQFIIKYNNNLKLLTIKNIDLDKSKIIENKKIFLEQRSGKTLQIVFI